MSVETTPAPTAPTAPNPSAPSAAYFAPRTTGPAPLVLGCMNFGKRTPEREAQRIVDLALERGIRLFDTANAYYDGESERVLGRILGARRDQVLIATKFGAWRREGLAAKRLQASLDESLSRLGTDHVDLYYWHVPDPQTPIAETVAALRDPIAVGKIRHFGISNFASWQILEICQSCDELGVPRPVVSQQLYNLLIRQLDLEYLRFAAKYGLHTTVYNPLAGGLLTPRALADRTIPSGTRFDKNPLYQRRYLSDIFRESASEYANIAAAAGLTLVQLAYAWLAQRPGVDSILTGPATASHLEDALVGVATPLAPELLTQIDDLHKRQLGTDASYAR